MEIEILVRNALTEAVVGWYEFKAIYLPCGVVDLAVTALQLWAFPQGWNMEWLTQPRPGWAKERALGIPLFSHMAISTVRTLLTLIG